MSRSLRTLLILCKAQCPACPGNETLGHDERCWVAEAIRAEERVQMWTKEKPTEAGWYWVRSQRHPAQIRNFQLPLTNPSKDAQPQPVDGPYSSDGWEEFAGPIPCPQPPNR